MIVWLRVQWRPDLRTIFLGTTNTHDAGFKGFHPGLKSTITGGIELTGGLHNIIINRQTLKEQFKFRAINLRKVTPAKLILFQTEQFPQISYIFFLWTTFC